MDAAALYAGTIVLRKTFEVLAQRSVTSLFSRLHARFRGQHKIEFLQQELESRLQVLSLPVDMCVQYVLHGNTVLQGALDMVIRVINDIVRFQEELESQAYNEESVKVSPSEVEARLNGFLTRLDVILPYMSVAMNAVSLLKSNDIGFSPSLLMKASHLIRSTEAGDDVISLTVKLYEYETRLALPQWQEKLQMAKLSLKVVGEYVLQIDSQEESDGDEAFSRRVPLGCVAAVGSSTLHVLGLGQHELEAIFLLDFLPSFPSLGGLSVVSDKEASAQTPVKEIPPKLVHYALHCVEDDEASSSSSSSSTFESESLEPKTAPLAILQYLIRLCMLQIREEKDHWLVPDERIRMFFADPRFISEPVKNACKPQKSDSPSQRVSTPLSGAKSFIRTPTTAGRTRLNDLFYELNLEDNTKK